MFEVHQLPIDFKIPKGVDKESFINAVYNVIVEFSEERNIEVISENWSTYIRNED